MLTLSATASMSPAPQLIETPRKRTVSARGMSDDEASLSTRSTDGEMLKSGRLKARLGEMLLERELLEAKIALLEARPGPLARRMRK